MTISNQFSQIAATDQIASGFRCLEYLLNSDRERIHFPEWAQGFREARGMEIDFDRLCWIWETITTEPAIYANWSKRIVSLNRSYQS